MDLPRQLKPVILVVTPVVSAIILSFLMPLDPQPFMVQISFLLLVLFGLEFGYIAGKSINAGYEEENEELRERLRIGAINYAALSKTKKQRAEAVDTSVGHIPSKVAARPTREVKYNPDSGVSERTQKAQMKARREAEEVTEHIVTHPQPLIDENAGKGQKKVKS